ncbi:restriction endonuclease [Idiomarina tyrosinivorans]|uniref:Restriction endonuclease n=1 Tax=Idiomarina tyrosinivorans TaxID=1445662 RepID=A0A432ZTH5_9GAMM|nr:restriction endonuclease subunit S [Idiomarina tyrosinivorans]RUO81234.1 restriction endonuclease [Idiomarina tyrosinivorans]
MKAISYLEKLLGDIDIAWKTLGDIQFFEIANSGRKPVKASLRAPGSIPYYGANNIQDYVEGHTHDGEFVLIAEDGSASLENYSVQHVTGKFWANNHVHVVRGKSGVNTRFLYHFLCTVNFIPFLSGGGRAKLTKGKLVDITIPIPCPENPEKSLQIQAKIVRILDAFTSLTAELTAELTARKKQYNYYRDKLLSFEDSEVEWKPLGEISRFINGRAYKRTELLESGPYPVLRVGNFFTNANWYYSDLELDDDKYCDNGDLLYAWSASFGPRIWDGGKVIYHYHIWKVEPNLDVISKKYLFYLLEWDTEALKSASGTGSTMMHVGKGAIEKRLVPVPSIPQQERIVTILDKFDALTNSITEGLPREIELRQKQYEYYRDLLLSFPKPDEQAA